MAGKFITGAIALAIAIALTPGCGNKGPLYLPDKDDTANAPLPQNESPD